MKPGDQYLFWQLSRWPDVQPGLRTWCLRLLSPSAGWCYWYRKRLHWSCSYWMLMQRRATGSRFNCADLLPKTGPPQKHICPCWLSGGGGGTVFTSSSCLLYCQQHWGSYFCLLIKENLVRNEGNECGCQGDILEDTEARRNFEESWRNDVLVGDQLRGDWFDVVWLMSKLPCGYRNWT